MLLNFAVFRNRPAPARSHLPAANQTKAFLLKPLGSHPAAIHFNSATANALLSFTVLVR